MSYKMNRRKFLTYVGCGCCGFVINSCTTAPITDRKQLKLIPEAKLNAQAAQIYEKVKEKEKLIKDTKSINEIKEIYKTVYRSKLDTATSLEQLQQQSFTSDEATHFIDFIRADSKRGFTKKQVSEEN